MEVWGRRGGKDAVGGGSGDSPTQYCLDVSAVQDVSMSAFGPGINVLRRWSDRNRPAEKHEDEDEEA